MAHPYATNSTERRYLPFFFAIAAIAISFLVQDLMSRYQISFPWWASPPVDTMAFYGVCYWLFDRYVWKWPPLRWLGVVKLPNLAGQWRGTVTPVPSSGVSAGLGLEREIRMSISQTWATLLISASTDLSNSVSDSGSITMGERIEMTYQYINEPAAGAPATMHTHRGTVLLRTDRLGRALEGEYYSGRDRQNLGTLRLVRDCG
jgi:hypothetical protein